MKYMTPVFILTDAFLANGSEPWMIPSLDDLPPIKFSYAEARDGQYMPYEREHRIGGLEREHISGNVSYDPDNHDLMVRLRAEKVAGMTREIPPTEVYGDATGDLLVLGWGSTYGAIRTSVEALRSEGKSVSHAHLKWLNPLPADLGEHLLKFQKVLIPEVNSGQLIKLIRSEFLIDAEGLNLVRGKPFRKSQIIAKVKEIL